MTLRYRNQERLWAASRFAGLDAEVQVGAGAVAGGGAVEEVLPGCDTVAVDHGLGAGQTVAVGVLRPVVTVDHDRSEEHTSELQSLMRISYAVFCLKKKNIQYTKIVQ